MDVLERVARMLEDETPRKRIAAAVVLGELQVKEPAVVSALCTMAKEPLDAYAEAAVEALGQIGSLKALPTLLDALGRGKEVGRLAAKAISGFGEDALPELRRRLDTATPEARAALAQLLPSVHGKQSLELTLAGLFGQTYDAVNKVTLAFRQELKNFTPAERKTARTQLAHFIEKKSTAKDEVALRGALKMLGYLALPETVDVLTAYLGPREPLAVRVEAITALRFALAEGASAKAMRRLMSLLDDDEALVARAARDTLTVLPLGESHLAELGELSEAKDAELALWAIGRLGQLTGAGVDKLLVAAASGEDRARAEAASRALVARPNGPTLLARALAACREDVGAQVLSEALAPHAARVAPKELSALRKAAAAGLGKQLSVARRQLEPVRAVDGAAWATLVREGAKKLAAKDPARAQALSDLLVRSSQATEDDRFTHACMLLLRSPLDLNPHARQKDSALLELLRLCSGEPGLAKRLLGRKSLKDAALYYVGFHLAEQHGAAESSVGYELLEALAKRKGKMAKAAKNKLRLLESA